jgi:NAD(P)-dependent dehydrogenase (short-subunit alcohol dehydrogenase family)
MEQIRDRPMAGKTVLITGATSGIGRATALGLAAMGAHVTIIGRDRRRADDAAREIRTAGGAQADVFVADLSSQSEVRRLAEEVLDRYTYIDVLINNAGGYWKTRHVTADGLELTFALNHLAPFLLTNLLIDRLKQSAPARVITISANAQAQGVHRLRRPSGREVLLRGTGVQPIQARKCVIQLRASQKAARHPPS